MGGLNIQGMAEAQVPARMTPEQVMDKAFFVHCTMGDKQLMAELIELFRSQIAKMTEEMIDTTDSALWKFQAHTLKGAAAAIGAVEIEMLASSWEIRGVPKRFSEREALCTTLRHSAKAFFVEADELIHGL